MFDERQRASTTSFPNAPPRDFLESCTRKMTRKNDTSQLKLQDRSELVEILSRQGKGSMIRGWRCELDPDGNLEVDFPDFCRAARRLAWSGDAHALFGEDLDFDSLTLMEVAPEVGLLMDNFKKWVSSQFSSPLGMFKSFDASGRGRISRDAFILGCETHGFHATGDELSCVFDACDTGNVGEVCADDVLFLEADKKLRSFGLYKAKMSQMREWRNQVALDFLEKTRPIMPTTTPTHRLAPRPWQADIFEQLPIVACQRRHDRCRDAHRRAQEALASFMQHLRSGYGNEVRAMRRALDPDGHFHFSQVALRHHCRKAQLRIRVNDLWRALDRDGDGKVSFEQFCTHPAIVLAQFQHWARARIGSCAAIWDVPEAASARQAKRGSSSSAWSSDKKMLFGPFTAALRALGCPVCSDPVARSVLLSSLDSFGCGLIVRADLEWLDGWKAPEWLYSEPDAEAWTQLKGLLDRTYRHPLRAWRMLLDRDSSNQLSWAEFKDACRKLHFHGNIGGAWRTLDVDVSGTISMKEYDPSSAELLASFKDWAETAFGSVALCFKAIDADRSGQVTFSEFKQECHKMKWQGDVRLLFECLDADGKHDKATGKRSISLEELSFLDSWHINPLDEGPAPLSASPLSPPTPNRMLRGETPLAGSELAKASHAGLLGSKARLPAGRFAEPAPSMVDVADSVSRDRGEAAEDRCCRRADGASKQTPAPEGCRSSTPVSSWGTPKPQELPEVPPRACSSSRLRSEHSRAGTGTEAPLCPEPPKDSHRSPSRSSLSGLPKLRQDTETWSSVPAASPSAWESSKTGPGKRGNLDLQNVSWHSRSSKEQGAFLWFHRH
mmetsp:Transcript_35813/g.102309  ORF Transcript_35813/g.102309 Transcript_35813/m.102309 type:complete len:838 (-) Transcript_35813:197-2710(-)